MSYKKCYATRLGGNKYKIHLWDSAGYDEIEWVNSAYQECPLEQAQFIGLNGEPLKKLTKWDKNTPNIHFHDMKPHQKFLVERFGKDDIPSKGHRELFFDIECEIGGALTEEYIERAPMPITSIAYWDKTPNKWVILILDKNQKIQPLKLENKEIIPLQTERQLLSKFIDHIRNIDPDILIGYNTDFFDIPYLYYRICNVLGSDVASYLSPINDVKCKKGNDYWYVDNQYVQIVGVESLDYMRLHKKYSQKDEPSWTLNALGKKYVGLGKIEYDGNLNQLFEADISKFVEYNFRDVEIVKALDEKFQYISLTKNLSHKGKHNYSEVYQSSITQDGAISAYLLENNIIPPRREINPQGKKGYAGGFLFCPKAGLYKYMFDEDLTSLYPSIIISLNIGKETYTGRIIDANDRNNRLGLSDLKSKNPNEILLIENHKGKQAEIQVKKLIDIIESQKWTISANGSMFRTDRESTLSIVLKKWFEERVKYKTLMKKAYKEGDKEKGEYYHLMQYTVKILLNSTYGATALPTWRYGMNHAILSEAITLSGWRIIQESALTVNQHINKVIKNQIQFL